MPNCLPSKIFRNNFLSKRNVTVHIRADSREFSLENSREFLGKIEDRRFSRIFQNSREFSRIFYSTVEPNFGKNSEKFKIFGISYFLRISDLMNSKLHRSVQNERIL